MTYRNGAADFLGKGFPFPLRTDGNGDILPASGEEDIRQAIYIILMTRQGERPTRPEFGSRIWDYVFELPDTTYMNMLRNEVVQAVCRWEHRVCDVEAEIGLSELSLGRVTVTVRYTVRDTNRPDNLVFPFYLEEGQW